ncbi:MAG: hypothetical protein EB127_08780 [Alphaproteobacteria bacterium]|nr:hypothetical protein [Alphaproteobacteria bacterium]
MNEKIANFSLTSSLIKILICFIGIIIFLYSRYAFIFFSAAILPSIGAFFADQVGHKCASATISTFNLLGVTPYLKKIYFAPSMNEAAKDMVINPYTWITIYTITFIGCLIYMIVPEILAQMYLIRYNLKIGNLVDRRDTIAKEWGIIIEAQEESRKDLDEF